MTEPIPSQRAPFVDRNRYITSQWWPWMKRLLATVQSNETGLATVNTEVDQINASWGVSINVNNNVVGLVRLDGGSTQSTFTVVADKFVVATPGDEGNTQTVFVAGNVAGVPTVGLAGSLIVDGTIAADALNVNTLSAISANIGTVTAGVIQSSDGKMVIDLDNATLTITA